ITHIDPITGEITLRCLDGLVNNFNESILQAIRCNMDIKFIGSGASAKAVLFYITNYITKSQLKTHVAYAALERAVFRLGESNSDDSSLTTKAKKLLQKCAFSLISEQELSAQQVATSLLGLEDHFVSHEFRNLYWIKFEQHINRLQPSPECYSILSSHPDFSDSEPDNNTTEDDDIGTQVENEDAENDEDDDDIGLSVGTNGELQVKADQIQDYCYR
ncbi:hypothetical protein GYMLUDRAFT_120964, partial [Collybiopsis luxurians FD-317 M1]